MSVAGIGLAARAGRCLGMAEALISHQGEFLAERAPRLVKLGECCPVPVVLGVHVDQVRALADLGSAWTVVAEDWAEGIGASLRAGLAAAAQNDVGAAIVVLADKPLLGSAAFVRLRVA